MIPRLTAVVVLALALGTSPAVALDHDGHHEQHAGHTEHTEHTEPAAPTPTVAGRRQKLAVTTSVATLGADSVIRVQATCSGRKVCRGKRWLGIGTRTPKAAYRVPAGGTRTWSFRLSAAQAARVPADGTVTANVVVRELKPRKLAARAFPIGVHRPASPPVPGVSEAYLNRNWTPTEFDTCPASLHRAFSVVGPDGKLYPTWHPPTVVDPATGETCTFGHEHGDDPRTSDIYALVAEQLASPDFPAKSGIPFGYVSEQLTEYAGANAGVATRHEDNVGHKIVVANDVRLVRADPRGFVYTEVDGVRTPVTCDVLMKLHQGSHSADATTNNAHELLYAMKCNDGTELVTDTMSRLGDPNEFQRGCQPTVTVPTEGSNLPDGEGGSRRIPDRACLDRYVLVDPNVSGAHSDMWGLYEVWQTANTLRSADGAVIASFDPWFGVRNPSRYFTAIGQPVGRPHAAAWETDPADNGVTNADPWLALMSLLPFAHIDPRSPFDGAERDFYLGQTALSNADGPTYWYTDPYGQHGRPVPFVGSVRQLVATKSTDYPVLERRIFDVDTDFGAGQQVHSPN